MTAPGAAAPVALRPHRRPNAAARALNLITAPYSGEPKFHRWLYQASGGRLGHGLIGAPTLLLHTTGRRTGTRRTTPVVYVYDRGRAVIGACNGGKGTPGWFHNISANPHVEVQLGRQHLSAVARVIPDSDPDYDARWQELDAVTHGRFRAYRARSAAVIPLVALEPGSAQVPTVRSGPGSGSSRP